MTTAVGHALFVARNFGLVAGVIMLVMIVANFLLALHTEHASVRQQLRDDEWLLKRCGEPDFYLKLKQHTDLCESVERNARRNVLLHCVAHALQSTQLCGFDSCTNIAAAIVQTLLYGGAWSLATFVFALLAIPLLLNMLYRTCVNSIAENHLRTKYNFPYGLNVSLLHAEHEAATLRRRGGLRQDVPRYELMGDVPSDMQLLVAGGGV
jgi:hypothetical protein